MGKENPFLFGDDLHQILFDLDGVGVLRQIQAARDALDVRIHHDAGRDSERGAEHYVRRLPRGAGDREEFLNGAWDLAAEISQDFSSGSDHRLRFVVEEPRGADILSQLGLIDVREILDGGVFTEQAGGHFIYALIRALSRQNGGDEEFPRVGVMERTGGAGVHLIENREDLPDARLSFGGVLGFEDGRWQPT